MAQSKSRVIKVIRYVEDLFNLKGSTWVGMFSLTMLWKVISGGTIGGDAITIYGLVLTNFVVGKTVRYFRTTKVETGQEED